MVACVFFAICILFFSYLNIFRIGIVPDYAQQNTTVTNLFLSFLSSSSFIHAKQCSDDMRIH